MPDGGAVRTRGRGIVRALRRLGDVTGKPIRITSKDDRIRVQKLVYLLRAGKYEPARKFDFNLYQNGPYSPGLTAIYFECGNDGIAAAIPAVDLPRPLEETLKDADGRGVQFLEALTTALDTVASMRRDRSTAVGLGPGLDWAKSIKPHIGELVWREVREFLRTHPELAISN